MNYSINKILRRVKKYFRNNKFNHFIWKTKNTKSIKKYGLKKIKNYSVVNFSEADDPELVSIAKHEAHRIEKAFYAGYMNTEKSGSYHQSHKNLGEILEILECRSLDLQRKDIIWLKSIYTSFHHMDHFLENGRIQSPTFDNNKLQDYEEFAKTRRSTRTWRDNSFSEDQLFYIGKKLIECARWAPCSGNRQPWFFKILIKQEDKDLLKGIKENHCITAPLVIFVGVHRSSYGAIGTKEQGMYVDGGAAAMQMVMAAHHAGLGSCWNHFCYDFVYSRPKNLPIFKNFYNKLQIPDDIEPIALVAFGTPAFVSPPPLRPPFEALCPDTFNQ